MGKRALSLLLIIVLTGPAVLINVSADEPVKIVSHKKYVDDSGLVHIKGIVENTGSSPVGYVHVTAVIEDKQSRPLATYDAVAVIRILMPGYVSPFDIPISDRNASDSLGSYLLSLRWSPVDADLENLEFSDIKALVVPHPDPRTIGYMGSYRENQHQHNHGEVHSHTEVSGTVTNTSQAYAESVRVAVIWYDRAGEFYDFDWQVISTKLAPDENGRFVFMFHPKPMGFYSLLAEGAGYTAALEQDGERIIPVFDAPKATLVSQLLSSMTITDINVVDEENNPVPELKKGKTVMLQSFIKNNMSWKQKFINIYQVKDADGITVMLFWMSSQLPPQESMDTAIAWTPQAEGTYTVEVYLWESMLTATPLGPYRESTLTVSG